MDAVHKGETVGETERTETPYAGMIVLHPKIIKSQIESGQNFSSLLSQSFIQESKEILLERNITPSTCTKNVMQRKLALISKKDIFTKAPKELMIQVGRFQLQNESQKEFVKGSIEKIPEDMSIPSEFFQNNESPKYRLRSIICHMPGMSNCHHYKAYVRKTNPETKQSIFVLTDDGQKPQEIPSHKVLEAASKNGYIFIYDKII